MHITTSATLKVFGQLQKKTTQDLPGNLKVVGVYPSQDGKTGTCLWEADNVEEVQDFLNQNAGQYAENFCYEVNVEKSMGLPSLKLVGASL